MVRKILFVVITLFTTATAYTQNVITSADEVINDACKIAAKEKKNVLVIFTASWCVWCRKMDKSIDDSVCKKFFDDNFVIRHLVVDEITGKEHLENPGADSIRNLYGGNGQGIPYWLIFDNAGKLLFDSGIKNESTGEIGNIGCPATENEVMAFIDKLKKTTKLNKEQLEIIYNRFRKNEM